MWCKVWILAWLFKRNPSKGLWVVSHVCKFEMYELERDYFQCNWKELKANFKHHRRIEKLTWNKRGLETWIICWKYIQNFLVTPSSFGIAWVILHAETLILQLGKIFVWIFDVITEREFKLLKLMFSCWDSEHIYFSFSASSELHDRLHYNDNWKLCKNRNRSRIHFVKKYRNLIFNDFTQKLQEWHFVWPYVHSGKSNFIMLVKDVKSKAVK